MRCEACNSVRSKAQLRRVGHPTTGDAEVGEDGKVKYAIVCVDSVSCQRVMVSKNRAARA